MAKKKWYRDDDGSLSSIAFLLVMIGLFIIAGILTFGYMAITGYYEVKAFNKFHGTDYSFGEWFWAEYTIKDYHIGEVKNLNVDLNIDDKCNGANQ